MVMLVAVAPGLQVAVAPGVLLTVSKAAVGAAEREAVLPATLVVYRLAEPAVVDLGGPAERVHREALIVPARRGSRLAPFLQVEEEEGVPSGPVHLRH
jgi:hypothetical protein